MFVLNRTNILLIFDCDYSISRRISALWTWSSHQRTWQRFASWRRLSRWPVIVMMLGGCKWFSRILPLCSALRQITSSTYENWKSIADITICSKINIRWKVDAEGCDHGSRFPDVKIINSLSPPPNSYIVRRPTTHMPLKAIREGAPTRRMSQRPGREKCLVELRERRCHAGQELHALGPTVCSIRV